jgi:hypothetical protein
MGRNMNKKLAVIGIVAILFCVGLSGCNESEDEIDPSMSNEKEDNDEETISVIMEAVAQVVDSNGNPVEGANVSFDFGYNDLTTKLTHHKTDSTGWTGFAVESVSIKQDESAFCVVFLTDKNAIYERHRVLYSEIEGKTINDAYYWSISDILVKI